MATKSTFATSFIIQKGKPRSDGCLPIFCSVSINCTTTSFYLKTDVAPERWLTKEGKTLGLSKEDRRINAIIDDFRGLVKLRYNEMLMQGEVVTAAKVKQAVMCMGDTRCLKLLTLCDEFNKDYFLLYKSGSVAKGTYLRYILARERLAQYTRENYNLDDIPLADINHKFIKGFDLWLRTKHNCANNTTARFIKHFRTIFNMALNNAWVKADPFASFKIQLEKVNRAYLTMEEIELLRNKEFSNTRLALVRDMFIFSIYTGISYIDVANLTEANVQEAFDGNLWIMLKRSKTNVNANIRLLDIPKKILEKYRGKQKDGKCLPVVSNQKMNEYLKEIATICSIDKKVSFHIARHSFATSITLSNGVPMESVSKMLGHTSIKTTQIYAKITDRKISKDMDMLAQKIDKKKFG